MPHRGAPGLVMRHGESGEKMGKSLYAFLWEEMGKAE